MLYLEIHQLAKRNLTVSQIANQFKISRTTVYKYLEMSFEEAIQQFEESKTRKKKLDEHLDWIVAWLEEYPHLSAAQIKDWLLEKFPSLEIGDSTVRLYVQEVREKYQIEKTKQTRQYEAIQQQPMGKQMQVDWGETKQKTVSKREIKLYFIAFVLAHSRHKYMEWQDRPFTTRDAIRCHENAFHFYGGMPNEIVYDQDHLLSVSENAGDLILTTDFQSYVKERNFRVHLCRKADPESKGMIENVVKFIKGNFADSRVFKDIDDWNERALQWLERTGNHNVHNTTKKRPAEVFPLEKQHLQPVSSLLSIESMNESSITRNVMKDNTVRFESNRYSVPIGTYKTKGNNQVFLEIKGSNNKQLVIRSSKNREVIAKHTISKEKGILIKNRNHGRDRSKGIEALKNGLLSAFEEEEKAKVYIEKVLEKYPRYRRDHLEIFRSVSIKDSTWLDKALEKCIHENLYSANDFKDVVLYLKKQSQQEPLVSLEQEKRQIHKVDIPVGTRPLSTYTSILGGELS